METIVKNFQSYSKTIPEILAEAGLKNEIADQSRILIKPNLTINRPSPTTTPPELIEEIIKFCKLHSKAKIIIAEGSGGCDTHLSFKQLGYLELAKKHGVGLVDLNSAERIIKTDPGALKLKKVALPKISFESYIINVPVLKAHSEGILTAAMKNIFGFYLNERYLMKAVGWVAKHLKTDWWNKSDLHLYGIHECIVDLNNYIKPHFHLVDGSIGQLGSEIDGYLSDPPVAKIIAGSDARQIDEICAGLLGINKTNVPYLL